MGLTAGPVRQDKYDYLNLHQKDIYGLLMPADCRLAAQDTINIDQLKSLPMILADQTFYGHQDLDWFGRRCPECSRYLQSDLQCHFSGRARRRLRLCFDRLVNTNGRRLIFRPISPELSVGLYIVTKKYQVLSPAAREFYERLKNPPDRPGQTPFQILRLFKLQFLMYSQKTRRHLSDTAPMKIFQL